jgi:DNA-binding transcriptional ArsR family regulator
LVAVAFPNRRKQLSALLPPVLLMEILSRQEACVGDIAKTMGERISTISERLRRLRDAGLVASRRQGKHRFYSVADSHVIELVLNSLSHATEDEIRN